MKLVSIVLLVCAIAMAAAAPSNPREYDVNDAPALFEQFIKDYERVYKDDEDKRQHYEAFVRSLHTINESNRKNPSATYGINKFADYTDEEKSSMFGVRNK